jgi:hypothetical protein
MNTKGKPPAKQPSRKIPVEKAREVLRHGEVHGKPLTRKQEKMFGAAAGRGEKK